MILPDHLIRQYIEADELGVTPAPEWENQLQPASLDLRLGQEFARFKRDIPNGWAGGRSRISGVIDPTCTDLNEVMKKWTVDPEVGCLLHPGEFLLATTVERVRIPSHLVARVEGRSSYGRLGIIVHSTAGFIDPGFEGTITLEMTNIGMHPVVLYPGTRICQLAFETLVSPAEKPYSGKYQGQIGTTPSRVLLDKQKAEGDPSDDQ